MPTRRINNKISIVIPTCDRHYLLKHTLQSCLLSNYPEYEVVVSDNYSSAETRNVINSFSLDRRVKYFRTNKRMSMPDHWEFAWQKATGDYVIMNGDDDTISPHLLSIINKIVNRFKPDIISWDIGLYHHPDWDISNDNNTLRFSCGHSNFLFFVDSSKLIENCYKFNFDFLPEGTRFCISRKIIDLLVKRIGRLFWPCSPDFTAPLLLLGIIDDRKYIYIDSVLGFGGRSKYSNAAVFQKNRKKVGCSERVVEFVKEFGNTDMFPYHDLKIMSFSNSHAAALSLAKGLLPEEFYSYEIDMVKLIYLIKCEFAGITYNPLLDEDQLAEFQKYCDNLPKQIVDEAHAAFVKLSKINRLRNILSIVGRKVGRNLEGNIRVWLGQQNRVVIEEAIIYGQKYGCLNSYDFAKNLTTIVSDYDYISGYNLDACVKNNLLLEAVAMEE